MSLLPAGHYHKSESFHPRFGPEGRQGKHWHGVRGVDLPSTAMPNHVNCAIAAGSCVVMDVSCWHVALPNISGAQRIYTIVGEHNVSTVFLQSPQNTLCSLGLQRILIWGNTVEMGCRLHSELQRCQTKGGERMVSALRTLGGAGHAARVAAAAPGPTPVRRRRGGWGGG